MIRFRRSEDRGHAEHGWLEARHSFSFSSYYDPHWMGWSHLRVINEDRVAPIAGFAPHSHRDMEIITYVLDGTLRHKDSTGGTADLVPGELQVMHAGRGITHSETNPSTTAPTHLLQIWIEPATLGVTPGYEQAALDDAALRRGFTRVVGPQGSDSAFHIHQDAALWIAWPAAGTQLATPLDPERRYYLHLARGAVRVDGQRLDSGDAALITHQSRLHLDAEADAEALLFDLP